MLTTPRGWALILMGSDVGRLFVAFAVAIGLFSIAMLLERCVAALTALGTSYALTTQNLRAVLPWRAIVVAGFAVWPDRDLSAAGRRGTLHASVAKRRVVVETET